MGESLAQQVKAKKENDIRSVTNRLNILFLLVSDFAAFDFFRTLRTDLRLFFYAVVPRHSPIVTVRAPKSQSAPRLYIYREERQGKKMRQPIYLPPAAVALFQRQLRLLRASTDYPAKYASGAVDLLFIPRCEAEKQSLLF
jgi:hypothetical protein